MQSDGRIVIAGGSAEIGGTSLGNILRLSQDGSLDSAFDTGGAFRGFDDDFVRALAVQQDGKTLAGAALG